MHESSKMFYSLFWKYFSQYGNYSFEC
uniref:Uncharacterized protein n=1 Tax=Arundo donax TaxID=35708 RepID=A0A0A9FTL3_ARUDO